MCCIQSVLHSVVPCTVYVLCRETQFYKVWSTFWGVRCGLWDSTVYTPSASKLFQDYPGLGCPNLNSESWLFTCVSRPGPAHRFSGPTRRGPGTKIGPAGLARRGPAKKSCLPGWAGNSWIGRAGPMGRRAGPPVRGRPGPWADGPGRMGRATLITLGGGAVHVTPYRVHRGS